jgi:sugar phosphate permease
MLGGLVAQTPLTILTEYWGWRKALIVDVVLGLVIMALIALLVKDYPKTYKHHYAQEMKELSHLGYWKSLRLAFLKPSNWCCGIYTCLLNLPIYLLGGIWGILYLEQTHQIHKTQASIATSCLFFGTIIGSPLAGWLSDRFRVRRLPMLVGAILSILVIFAIMFIKNVSLPLVCVLFFALGLVTATQIISYPTVAESNPKPLTATSVSVVSITTLSGGAIFEPFFGWLMHVHWNGTMQNGAPLYSSADYQFAMWLFPIAFAVGLIAALLVRETHGHKKTFLS